MKMLFTQLTTQETSSIIWEKPLYSVVKTFLRTLNVTKSDSILALVYIHYERFHQVIYYNVAC